MLGVGRDASMTDDTFREHDAQGARGVGRSRRRSTTRCGRSVCSVIHFVSADFTDAARLRERSASGSPRSRCDARPEASATGSSISPCRRACSSRSCATCRRAASRRGRARRTSARGRASSSRSRSAAASTSARAAQRSRCSDCSPSTRSTASITIWARRRCRTSSCSASPTRSSSRSGTGSHIDHVQITAAETVGVEHRGGVLRGSRRACATCSRTTCCSCWRSPRWSRRSRCRADAVRDEKVKVLHVDPLARPRRRSHEYAVRAQYTRGRRSAASAVPGYREEPDVAPDSDHADVRRRAALRRQLALERRAVLPALGQAAAAPGVGDRDPVPRAAAPDVRPEAVKRSRRTRSSCASSPNERRLAPLRGEGAGRGGGADVEHRDRAGRHGLRLRRGVRRGRRRRRTRRCCST